MSDHPPTHRRQALAWLAGLPLLPLAGPLSARADVAKGMAAKRASRKLTQVSFVASPAPVLDNPLAMSSTTVHSALRLRFSDRSEASWKLAYETFFITGDMVPDGAGGEVLAGGYRDFRRQPIMDRSVPGKERQFFSDAPDGTTLFTVPGAKVDGVKGRPVFAVVQFEFLSRDQSQSKSFGGTMPAPIAVLTLDQDPATGKLTLVKYHDVDTSSVRGLWTTCGASLSPWGTHLSSEEYEPDAFAPGGSRYLKHFSRMYFGDESTANPYHYGHLPEVTVHPDGTGSVKKHYCLGRISHELIQVMPDERTALMGDDYTNGGLFMFVADRPRDLSSGTLYVARLGPGFSLDPKGRGAALKWIRLGHATSAEIEALASQVRPQDIMSVRHSDPDDASYTRMVLDGELNWVKLHPGQEKAAAFLETHRYANLKGASMAFTKLEGTTVNARDKIAYSALQAVEKSMVKGDAAWVAGHNVGLAEANPAGAVLAHTLAGGQRDTEGQAIDSEWVPVRTRTLLAGRPLATPDAVGNLASPDWIANPDNLKFSEALRTLFISEDSPTHVNNMVWAYQVDTGQLTRLATVPVGAESTGLHVSDDVNGWTYIMSNFQHAGEWRDKLHAKARPLVEPLIKQRYRDRFGAAVGYLTAHSEQIRLKPRST
jgi:hypothetical protein